jgi:hypothetical protein
MKGFGIIIVALTLGIVIVGCSGGSKGDMSGDWASNFVIYEGDMYIFNNETVENVDEVIGEVVEYSDNEAVKPSKGIFSNKYPIGSKIYSIKGENIKKTIAVEYEGEYFKAKNSGKYNS